MSDDKDKKLVVDGVEEPPLPKTKVPFYINWQSVAHRLQKERLKKMFDEIPEQKIVK